MPVSLFVKNFTMTSADDPDSMMPDQFEKNERRFDLEYTREHFYVVNWDDEKTMTVDVDLFETLNFEYLDREKEGGN